MSTRDTPLNASNLYRRDFLKTVGVTIGGLALNGLSSGPTMSKAAEANPVPSLSHVPTIGLLFPRSNTHIHLGENLAAGLRLALREADSRGLHDAEYLRIEEVGFAPGDILEKAKKLLCDDRVDILVGMLNPTVAVDLHATLESSNKLLILAEAGANVVRDMEHSPFVFHNTLGYWRASWAAGEWVVRNVGRKIFVACSFYESGYDAVHAFSLGVEQAGGAVLQTFVSHVPPMTADMRGLMKAIDDARPDAVYAVYAGNEAAEFTRAFFGSPVVQHIPLIGSSFMTEGPLHEGVAMRFCSSWAPGVRGEKNVRFKAAFRKITGRQADSFAVLGYDTGCLVAEAARGTAGDMRDHVRMREVLRQATLRGPRGTLHMNPETHNMMTPLYVCETRAEGQDIVNQVVHEMRSAPESTREILALRRQARSGWLNAYLSV